MTAKTLLDFAPTTTIGPEDLLYAVLNVSTSPVDASIELDDLFKSRNGNESVTAYASLSAAVTAIGSNVATLEIPSTLAVTADLTVPSNITLLFIGAGVLSISSTKTLIVSGPIVAPIRQIFSGAGSVRVVTIAYPQWFGAVGNSRHVDDGAINTGVSATTLTSATAVFTASDVGRTVSVKGAGASGVTLITTISGFTNSTTVTLAASASTTVSSKRIIIGTNDTTAMSAWAASGAAKLAISQGKYLVRMTATGNGAVTIPSNTAMVGDGPSSIIYCIGSDGKNGGSSADDDQKAGFYIADGSTKIWINRVAFIGENGPYSEPSQNQSSVIWMPGSGSTTTDIFITQCSFDNLFGFSVHNAGTGQRIHVTHNAFKNNANGLNVNADYSIQTHNTFDHCEGMEASGAYSCYSFNILNDCGLDTHNSAAMSIGGRTSVGDWGLGSIVQGNRIIASRSGGIALSDGFVEGQCVDNYVLKSYEIGIQQVASSGNDIDRNTIARNTVISCGHSGASNPYGIFVSNGNDTKVLDNDVRDRSIASYAMTIAIYDGASALRTHIDGNTVSGTSHDFNLYGASCQFGQSNIYNRTKVEMLSNGSLASPIYRGTKSLTNNTTTSIIDITLPTLAAVSGEITYRCYQGTGGDVQIRSGVVRFSAVNKAGVYSSEVAVVNEAASVGSGTLTGTWSIVTGTNKITLKFNGNSSLFGAVNLDYTIQNESAQTMVIL